METTRQKKISRLIQKELSNIFQSSLKYMFNKVIISITNVKVTPDLAQSKVFVSVFPVKEPEKIILKLKKNKSIIRKELGKNIRTQLRVVPDLDFFLDNSAEYAELISNLIKK
tara:strand:+ start:92 stop:430 length:339 start_codon:yes stop_codon:yes gene_type:complete